VHESVETAAPEVQGVLYRSPQLYGLARSRWDLQGIRQTIAWLRDRSIPGVHRILNRLHVSYKRGREHVHSPDLEYDKKMALIRHAQARCAADPEHLIFLYEDEHTSYARPPVGAGYASTAGPALKAEQGTSYNSRRRIAACLEPRTGRLIERQRGSFNLKEMARFFLFVEGHFPDATTIYMALDNWPVHFHPTVLAELEQHQSRIQLLPLPTYAPWTNPVEKVWRKLNQERISLHRLSGKWDELKQAITDWFEPFHQGSEDLLHYVGLRPTPAGNPYPT
jgi:transposase